MFRVERSAHGEEGFWRWEYEDEFCCEKLCMEILSSSILISFAAVIDQVHFFIWFSLCTVSQDCSKTCRNTLKSQALSQLETWRGEGVWDCLWVCARAYVHVKVETKTDWKECHRLKNHIHTNGIPRLGGVWELRVLFRIVRAPKSPFDFRLEMRNPSQCQNFWPRNWCLDRLFSVSSFHSPTTMFCSTVSR